MCIILSNSKRGQTSILISYTMKEAQICFDVMCELVHDMRTIHITLALPGHSI